VGWKCGLRKRLPGIGLYVGLVDTRQRRRVSTQNPLFHGLFVIAFARIHARWPLGVSARIPVTSVAYGDARRYDEAVVTRGFAGY